MTWCAKMTKSCLFGEKQKPERVRTQAGGFNADADANGSRC